MLLQCDPTYAGVSNNHYLHLENATVTRGGDTAYSKLNHTQLATTAQTPSAEYSSLSHPTATTSSTVQQGHHGDSKLAAGNGDQQEYSSLHHHGVPASDIFGLNTMTAVDQHQYSVVLRASTTHTQ